MISRLFWKELLVRSIVSIQLGLNEYYSSEGQIMEGSMKCSVFLNVSTSLDFKVVL